MAGPVYSPVHAPVSADDYTDGRGIICWLVLALIGVVIAGCLWLT